MYGQGDAIDQAVRDLDGLNGECAQAKAFSGADLIEHGAVEQSVLFQLVFDIGQRELGGKDRHVHLGEQPGNGTDMVHVPVRKHDAAHVRTVGDEVGEIGDYDIDAEQLGFGKHQPGIDDDDVVAPAHGHAVHAEFAEAAEGNDLKLSGRHASCMLARWTRPMQQSGSELTSRSHICSLRQMWAQPAASNYTE